MKFELQSEYTPSGDQPEAIKSLVSNIKNNVNEQILLGVTGSGKTFTMAHTIAELNRPALILAHNKTLAAQLCAEFRRFFPNNAVEYFVSYYDYYQPEAYVAQRDLYIEKESDINEEIERLRHSATRSLLTRNDTIIVASVSCIYGLGVPEEYLNAVIPIKTGDRIPRRKFLLELEDIQYERNDIELKQGRYRVKGDTIDIFPVWSESLLRLEFFGDECEKMSILHPITGEVEESVESFELFPATHYVVKGEKGSAIANIRTELHSRVARLRQDGLIVEAQRLEQRTKYDLEMMEEIGYCKGVENYARHLSGKQEGEPPGVLLDFFPDNFITFIDESHVTMPQVRGMYQGDRSRKMNLVDYGFRLPSALDNRPLNFDEFNERIKQRIYVSATPADYELEQCKFGSAIDENHKWSGYHIAEQIIRPTGLLDPEIDVRTAEGQIEDLYAEILDRIEKDERVLVTAVTKKMSEDLSNYFANRDLKVRYLHSDITTLERVDILHELRSGKIDVLIGVNLLREGLDLPEVSLVAILDADKEGFLRNEKSLVQTIGRAARNENGQVILYAEKMTDSMSAAISETSRRRQLQIEHNQRHGITPKTVRKELTDIRDEDREKITQLESVEKDVLPSALPALIESLERQMEEAAAELKFEVAAVLRDKIESLKN